MSSFKAGFLSGGDPVADIFSRPPGPAVAGDSPATGKERFEISALPSRDKGQTNWTYRLLNHDKENKLLVNMGDRTYQWQVPKEFPELAQLPDLGGTQLTARRLTDIDSHQANEMLEKAKLLSEGRLQVHSSGPSKLHATFQDGKVNPTINLSHGSNNSWNIVPRPGPRRNIDPAKTLASMAMGMKQAFLGFGKKDKSPSDITTPGTENWTSKGGVPLATTKDIPDRKINGMVNARGEPGVLHETKLKGVNPSRPNFSKDRSAKTQESFGKFMSGANTSLRMPTEGNPRKPVGYSPAFRNQLYGPLAGSGGESAGVSSLIDKVKKTTPPDWGLNVMPNTSSQYTHANDQTINMGLKPTVRDDAPDASKALVRDSRGFPGSTLAHEHEHTLQDGRGAYSRYEESLEGLPTGERTPEGALAREEMRGKERDMLAEMEVPAVFAETSHALDQAERAAPGSADKVHMGVPSHPSGMHRENAGKGWGGRQWLDSAREHYLDSDKSMTELLNTPEGRQFLEKQYGSGTVVPESFQIPKMDTLSSKQAAKKDEEEEEDQGSSLGMLPAAGVGAAGLGAMGIARGLGTDSEWNNAVSSIQSMSEVGKTMTPPPGSTILQHYAKSMAPAAKLRVAGISVPELIPAVRRQEWFTGSKPLAPEPAEGEPLGIAQRLHALLTDVRVSDKDQTGYNNALKAHEAALGKLPPGKKPPAAPRAPKPTEQNSIANFLRQGINQPSATIDNPTSDRAAAAHYEAFAKGPVPGYSHMLRGYEGHRTLPESLTGKPGVRHGEYFGPKFDAFISNHTRGQSNGTGAMLLSDEFTQDYMNDEEQGRLLDKWMESLTPEERTQLEGLEIDKMNALGHENYRPMVEGVNNFRNKAKDFGMRAGGAGAGGLLAHGIYKGLRKDEKENWAEDALATGAGMTAGGLAGHFLGTDSGRKSLQDFIGRIRGASAKTAGLQSVISAREAQEGWGIHNKIQQVLQRMGLSTAQRAPITGGIANEVVKLKGTGDFALDENGKPVDPDEATRKAKGMISGLLKNPNQPIKNTDHLLRPIYTPTGYNPWVGYGVAAGLGGLAGGAYHFMKERGAKAQARLEGRPYTKPTGNVGKRMLVGGLLAGGASMLSNKLIHATDNKGPTPALGGDPFPDHTPAPVSGSQKGASANIVDVMTMGPSAMDTFGPQFLKQLVFAEPALPADDKRRLMWEIDAAQSSSADQNIHPTDVLGPGLGGLTGYLVAKSRGYGPVATGLVTGLGGYAGHKLMQPPARGRNSLAGQPGSRMF